MHWPDVVPALYSKVLSPYKVRNPAEDETGGKPRKLIRSNFALRLTKKYRQYRTSGYLRYLPCQHSSRSFHKQIVIPKASPFSPSTIRQSESVSQCFSGKYPSSFQQSCQFSVAAKPPTISRRRFKHTDRRHQAVPDLWTTSKRFNLGNSLSSQLYELPRESL